MANKPTGPALLEKKRIIVHIKIRIRSFMIAYQIATVDPGSTPPKTFACQAVIIHFSYLNKKKICKLTSTNDITEK